jgi:AraC family transcriptional regulator
MQIEKPLIINAGEPEKLKPILPKPVILSTPVTGWNGFYFAYHRQLNHKIPETCPDQHISAICIEGFQANMKINKQWQHKSYSPSDVAIFPAHQISPAVEFEQELGFIILCLEPEFVHRAAYESVDADNVEIIQQLQSHDLLIQQLGLALKRELEISIVDSRLYAESAANMLAVHLLKRYSARKLIIKEYTGGLPKHKLKEVISYINENLDTNLSLGEISAIAQMSPHYFASLFKQSTGIAPHQYVTKCRIDKAKHLLAKRELSILQVSHVVGFQSQSHFAKVFRKYVGITPQAFKANFQ